MSGKTTIEFKKLDEIVKLLGIGLENLFDGEIPQKYIFHQKTAHVAWWLYKINWLKNSQKFREGIDYEYILSLHNGVKLIR